MNTNQIVSTVFHHSCLFVSICGYFSDNAATPGSTLPSRNSRDAPPPVEVCDTFLSAPNFFAAVAVSPPPTTVVAPAAVAATMASAMDLVAFSNAGNSNTPGGPFQMMVLARAMTAANSLDDSGPASMPSNPAGMPLCNVAVPTLAS